MRHNSKRLAMFEVEVKMAATRNAYKKELCNRSDLTYRATCMRNVEVLPVKKHAFLSIERSFLNVIVSLLSWIQFQ